MGAQCNVMLRGWIEIERAMDTNLNILIVDNFASMRRVIKNLLSGLGYHNTSEAADGSTALPALQNGQFDLLITDWDMPDMTGIELLKAVRADPKLGSLPVLMVTAEAKRDQILEAAEAGVNAYIIKPFTARTMRQKLDKLAEQIEVSRRKRTAPSN